MKRILFIASALTLGACSQGGSDTQSEAEQEENAEILPADTSAWLGGYNLAYEDGSEAQMVIGPDGAYQITQDGETRNGLITMGDGGSFCYTDEGSSDTECWTNGDAAEDGSWPSTSDQGRTITVSRIEE